MDGVQLQSGTEDIVTWRWSPTGEYSACSTYRAFFHRATRFAGVKMFWKSWAPMKVKFFMWLAAQDRLCTADRRCRRGLQSNSTCNLCNQGVETAHHIFAKCAFMEVCQAVSMTVGIANQPATSEMQVLDWWIARRRGFNKLKQKGIDSAFMLLSWRIWKERNGRVFSSQLQSAAAELTALLLERNSLQLSAGRWGRWRKH